MQFIQIELHHPRLVQRMIAASISRHYNNKLLAQGLGVNISKMREMSRTAEKIDKKKNSAEKITKTCNPHPTPSDGGGVRGENVKVTKLQGLKSISGMQLS